MTNERDKRPTLEDVAREVGLSRSLVSLALRGKPGVAPKSRAAILSAARELEYVPNSSARNLASTRNRVIGVLIGTLMNPHHAAIAMRITDVAYREGYEVLLNTVPTDKDRSAHAMQSLVAWQIAGLILVGVDLADEQIAKAAESVPCVTVGRTTSLANVDAIYSDDEIGAHLVVDHLVELGHEAIVHLDGGDGAGAEGRRKGYRQAMRDHGLAESVSIVSSNYSSDGGARAVEEVFERNTMPTAIFAANDYCAIGALRTLLDNGIRVPEDVSLVGYDNTLLASHSQIPLTSVDQSSDQLASEATLRVIQRAADSSLEAKRIVSRPKLIARESTASRS